MLYCRGVGIYDEPLLFLVWYTTIIICSILDIGSLSNSTSILSLTSIFWDCKVSSNESTDELTLLLETKPGSIEALLTPAVLLYIISCPFFSPTNEKTVSFITEYWQTVWILKDAFFQQYV